MKAIRVAHDPPTIAAHARIQDAVPMLKVDSGCALAVVDGRRLVGTLSKDDVLKRVVEAGRDPATTTVGDVMTAPPVTVTADAETSEALKLMRGNGQCFLPVVDREGRVKAWLAVCSLLETELDSLSEQVGVLATWIGADAPGG